MLLVLLAPVAAGAAESAPASPQTTFYHANALYKDGQYAAAAGEYEQLLRAGLSSGNLYFNLANAYVKAGDKGKAILNYERAQRLIPADPDVQANLSFARSLTGVEACTPAVWERLVFPLASRLSTGTLIAVGLLTYTLLFVALTVHRLWRRRPRWLLYVAWGCGFGVVVATASLARRVAAEEWQQAAVIVAAGNTPARFEPASTGTEHYVLKEGSLVTILDSREGWLQVARCDGRRGWVPRASVVELSSSRS